MTVAVKKSSPEKVLSAPAERGFVLRITVTIAERRSKVVFVLIRNSYVDSFAFALYLAIFKARSSHILLTGRSPYDKMYL